MIVAGGVQRLAEILPGQLRRSGRRLSVDQRLLEHGGGIQVCIPQPLTLGPRLDAKFLCPQSVSDRLIPLPRPLPALVCELITSVGSSVTVRSSQVATVGDLVAFGSVQSRLHVLTLPLDSRPAVPRHIPACI